MSRDHKCVGHDKVVDFGATFTDVIWSSEFAIRRQSGNKSDVYIQQSSCPDEIATPSHGGRETLADFLEFDDANSRNFTDIGCVFTMRRVLEVSERRLEEEIRTLKEEGRMLEKEWQMLSCMNARAKPRTMNQSGTSNAESTSWEKKHFCVRTSRNESRTQKLAAEPPSIVVMGITGTGKSTLIHEATWDAATLDLLATNTQCYPRDIQRLRAESIFTSRLHSILGDMLTPTTLYEEYANLVYSNSAVLHNSFLAIQADENFRDEGKKRERNQDVQYGRHGDIKLENILRLNDIESAGGLSLQIADFGLGRFQPTNKQWKIEIGGLLKHLMYKPREIRLEREISRAIGICSLGCPFYTLKRSNDLPRLNTTEEGRRRLIYIDDIGDIDANLILIPTKGNLGLDSQNSGYHSKDRQSHTARKTDATVSTSGFTHHAGGVIRRITSNLLTKGARATSNLTCLAPFLLLFATPASASPTFAEDHTFTLHRQIANFLRKFAHPGENMQPAELLLTLFLETLTLVALYTHNRDDAEQKYFIGAGLLCSTIAGAVYSSTAQDFVIQYLFLGCLVALVGSAISHAGQRRRERGLAMTEKEACFKTAEIEDRAFRDEKM